MGNRRDFVDKCEADGEGELMERSGFELVGEALAGIVGGFVDEEM